jgi:hypothetical protein
MASSLPRRANCSRSYIPRITWAYARQISRLHYGRIDPRTVGFELPDSRRDLDVPTAAHQLFSASRRTFSHGCIRVADPVALASYRSP